MNLRFLLLLLAATIILNGGCSKSSSEEKKPVPETNTALKQPSLKDVTPAEIKDVITSYKGEKAVLVNVWATWCIPCVEEFPEIVEIQRKYPEKLQVVFISADFPVNRDKAVDFLKKQGVDWTTYFKTGKDEPFITAVSPDWSGALPFTKVVDTNGNVIAHWENKADFDTFNTHVKQAINP